MTSNTYAAKAAEMEEEMSKQEIITTEDGIRYTRKPVGELRVGDEVWVQVLRGWSEEPMGVNGWVTAEVIATTEDVARERQTLIWGAMGLQQITRFTVRSAELEREFGTAEQEIVYPGDQPVMVNIGGN